MVKTLGRSILFSTPASADGRIASLSETTPAASCTTAMLGAGPPPPRAAGRGRSLPIIDTRARQARSSKHDTGCQRPARGNGFGSGTPSAPLPPAGCQRSPAPGTPPPTLPLPHASERSTTRPSSSATRPPTTATILPGRAGSTSSPPARTAPAAAQRLARATVNPAREGARQLHRDPECGTWQRHVIAVRSSRG